MSYFNNVYLKRINRFGKNIQERVQGKKEYDFQFFKAKSPNKVNIFKNDNFICDGVLQNKINNEKEVVDYLLVNNNISFSNGTILDIVQYVNIKKQKWLVFHLDDYVSIGYNRYQITKLDNKIEWIDDGIIYSADVHFTGSGANLRDKSITSKFRIQYNVVATYIPNKILSLVMKANPNFKKGVRILINNEVWKVSGIDKISVPGVFYATLEEDYIDKMDDIDYANAQKLSDWTIQSNYGMNIKIPINIETEIIFVCYYQGERRKENIEFNIDNNEIVQYKDNKFIGLKIGITRIRAFIQDSPEIYRDFELQVLDTSEIENFSIIGPEKIKMFDIITYQISNTNKSNVIIESVNDNIEIQEIIDSSITIKAIRIGIAKLIVKKEDSIIYEKEISVESIWMEG